MTSLNDYLSISKTIPETPNVNNVELFENSSNGVNKTTLKAHDNLSADYILTLPTGSGSSNQCLQTDGSGNLSWTSVQPLDSELTALSTLPSASNKIPRFTGSGTADLLDFKDENTMASNSATAIPSQRSVKEYVDSVAEGLHVLTPVKAATTGNISLSNIQTIDGVNVVANDRVLVKDQTSTPENGIYICVDGGSWTRATDFDDNDKIRIGDFVFCENGTVNGNHGFVMTTSDGFNKEGGDGVVGTHSIIFTQFSGAEQIIAGDGINKNGNIISVSFTDTQTISKDTDGEFIALKLKNESDAGDTTGKVSLEFNLEDTGGNNVDSGKITVVKEQSFTNSASTHDSTMEFYTSSDGTINKVCDMTSDSHLDIQGGLKIGSGGKTYGPYSAVLKQLFIRSTYDMSVDYGWWIGTQNFTLSTTSNKLYFTVQGGGGADGLSVPAYIDDGNRLSTTQMNFTGQHRCFIQNELTDMIGLIVSSTGNYVNIDNSLSPTINESLPICMLSHLHNDKSVFGVVSEKEDTNTTRTYKPSNFVSVIQKKNTNEQRYHINSLGEGGIWITNKNAPIIENGDYITSSTIPGYGQKQSTEQLCNYTVAKITCDCNFTTTPTPKQKVKVTGSDTNQQLDLDESGNIQLENDLDSDNNIQNVLPFETRYLLDNGTQITETEYNTRLSNGENVYIACFVGCTYHCG
jgi:hypothetical protein